MGQLFYYSTIVSFCTLTVEAMILPFRFETIKYILLDGRKKRLLDFTRVMFLIFAISWVVYNYSHENTFSYASIFITSLFFTVIVYSIALWIKNNLSIDKNYFIKDEKYRKLYLIKNSNKKFILLAEKYILLADKPSITESKIVLFKGGTVIGQKRIYSEPRNLSLSCKEVEKCERKEAGSVG